MKSARGGPGLTRIDTLIAATQEQRGRLLLWEAFARWGLLVYSERVAKVIAASLKAPPLPPPPAPVLVPVQQQQLQQQAPRYTFVEKTTLMPAQSCSNCGNIFLP